MVNTFLIDKDFATSATLLDPKRLGKQRVEAFQILNLLLALRAIAHHLNTSFPTLEDPLAEKKEWIKLLVRIYKTRPDLPEYRLGFVYHPAVVMWMNYEVALAKYINVHIDEWIKRGYKNTMDKYLLDESYFIQPKWLTNEFIKRHKGSLMVKAPAYYSSDPSFVASLPFEGYIWG